VISKRYILTHSKCYDGVLPSGTWVLSQSELIPKFVAAIWFDQALKDHPFISFCRYAITLTAGVYTATTGNTFYAQGSSAALGDFVAFPSSCLYSIFCLDINNECARNIELQSTKRDWWELFFSLTAANSVQRARDRSMGFIPSQRRGFHRLRKNGSTHLFGKILRHGQHERGFRWLGCDGENG
jgi:hypothetical protein